MRCGAQGPDAVASRSPSQGATGSGGVNRRSPTGAAAYGMPRKWQTDPRRNPTMAPAGKVNRSDTAFIAAHYYDARDVARFADMPFRIIDRLIQADIAG